MPKPVTLAAIKAEPKLKANGAGGMRGSRCSRSPPRVEDRLQDGRREGIAAVVMPALVAGIRALPSKLQIQP